MQQRDLERAVERSGNALDPAFNSSAQACFPWPGKRGLVPHRKLRCPPVTCTQIHTQGLPQRTRTESQTCVKKAQGVIESAQAHPN